MFFLAKIPGSSVFAEALKSTPEVTPEVEKMLVAITGEMTRGEIQKRLGLKDEKHFSEYYQQVAVKLGLIEMTSLISPEVNFKNIVCQLLREKYWKSLKK